MKKMKKIWKVVEAYMGLPRDVLFMILLTIGAWCYASECEYLGREFVIMSWIAIGAPAMIRVTGFLIVESIKKLRN